MPAAPLNLRVATPGQVERRRFAAMNPRASSPMRWHYTSEGGSERAASAPTGAMPSIGRYLSARSVFHKIVDLNGDGVVDSAELTYALRKMGRAAPDEKVRTLMAKVDADRNGVLDEDEFARLVHAQLDLDLPPEEDDELKAVERVLSSRRAAQSTPATRPPQLATTRHAHGLSKKSLHHRSPVKKGMPISPTKAGWG